MTALVRGKRIRSAVERIEAKLNKATSSGCWEYTGNRLPKGYGMVYTGQGGTRYVHRIMFEHANGYLPPVVRHRCDNPPCCNPAHLEPGDIATNNADTAERGRVARGDGNAAARLTADQVLAIRSSADLQADLAVRYGVSQSTISEIKNRKRWSHL